MTPSSFDEPVVMFIYKRPETTQKLFSIIRQLRPLKLYIFANGPCNENEKTICEETRNVVDNVDWNCNVTRRYESNNIGLGNRIISGLDFLFEHEETGIILEDDCLPDLFFFEFCSTLLKKYKDDNRIFHINGVNINEKLLSEYPYSYFATRFSLPSWGWATWRRAWRYFKKDREKWQKNKNLLFTNFQQKNFAFWTDTFASMKLSDDLWDVQWNIDIWKNRGIVLTSTHTLINNIGNDLTATYMKQSATDYLGYHVNVINRKILHPDIIKFFEKEYIYEDDLCSFIKHCF